MTMRFTATVKNREVVIRGVDLPDGDEVDVTIDEAADEDGLTASDLRRIDRGLAQVAAGKVRPLDDLLIEIRQRRELRDRGQRRRRSNGQARGGAVGSSRPRTKQARGRARDSR